MVARLQVHRAVSIPRLNSNGDTKAGNWWWSAAVVAPTAEQLADAGAADGIPALTAAEWDRAHRRKMSALSRQVRRMCRQGRRGGGDRRTKLLWVERGVTFDAVYLAARAMNVMPDLLYRHLRGESVPRLAGVTLRRV